MKHFSSLIILAESIFGYDFMIPVTVDWMDVMRVDALVYNSSASFRRNISLTVTMAHVGTFLNGPPIDRHFVSFQIILNDAPVHYISEDFSFQPDESRHPYFPIGPFSDFRSSLGDVAVIKQYNNRNMTLQSGISSRIFEHQFCTPNSLVRLSAATEDIPATVRFGSETVRYQFVSHQFLSTTPGAIMTIPRLFFDSIRNHTISNGAVFLSDENLFRNCNRGTIRGLDNIHLELSQSLGPGQARLGSLTFTPEDFFAFNSETNECYLKLVLSVDMRFVAINPFAMPGTNTRVSRRGIEICDTLL